MEAWKPKRRCDFRGFYYAKLSECETKYVLKVVTIWSTNTDDDVSAEYYN